MPAAAMMLSCSALEVDEMPNEETSLVTDAELAEAIPVIETTKYELTQTLGGSAWFIDGDGRPSDIACAVNASEPLAYRQAGAIAREAVQSRIEEPVERFSNTSVGRVVENGAVVCVKSTADLQ